MLKRKTKGAAMDPSPYYVVSEDAKSRFRHQALLQDFHDLKKETDARRNHLEKAKQKKSILLAEVQFLRRRYQHLLKNQPLTPPPLLQDTAHPQKKQKKSDASGSRRNKKVKNAGGEQAASRPPVPSFPLTQKERNHSGKKAASRQPVVGFDLNHNERVYSTKDAAVLQPVVRAGKEVVLRNSSPILDLNRKDDRAYSGKEAASSNPITAFDLNQISREDEEYQCDPDTTSMIRGGNDEPQYIDMKLSACRSSGNSSSRAGKRKLSWQDQISLRV